MALPLIWRTIMANLPYTVQEEAGVYTDLGRGGFVRVRLTHDGSSTTTAVTLPATSSIQTIYDVIGGTSHDVPVTGVAGTTGFASVYAAGTSTKILTLLVYGKGR